MCIVATHIQCFELQYCKDCGGPYFVHNLQLHNVWSKSPWNKCICDFINLWTYLLFFFFLFYFGLGWRGVRLWELVIQGFEVQYSTFFCLLNSLNVDLGGILLHLCFWILCLAIGIFVWLFIWCFQLEYYVNMVESMLHTNVTLVHHNHDESNPRRRKKRGWVVHLSGMVQRGCNNNW